jgi:isochorismate synthase
MNQLKGFSCLSNYIFASRNVKMAETLKKDIQDSINDSIEKKLPFVFYRLPENEEIHFIRETLPGNFVQSEAPGFMFSPFQQDKDTWTYFIRNDTHIVGSLEDLYNVSFKIEDICGGASSNRQLTKDDFYNQVNKAVDSIKKGELDKVILSRIEEVKVEMEPLRMFIGLCKKYNSAFVALVVIPGQTVWLTASPELLVSLELDKIKTVSLAGTKLTGDKTPWGDKEKHEQQIVTDYIQDLLKKHCSDIKVSAPENIVAGNVMHLKSEFHATLTTDLLQLVKELHPTPAICGTPKDKALAFINNTELHHRKYYTGYLGPCNIEGETDLFVNLRCAELFKGKANLYIGGGITADSDPEKEWSETNMKAQTLLSVIAPATKAV